MCSIDAYEKHKPSSMDDGSSGGVNVLPSNLTTEALVSLSATIYFIDSWLQWLEHNSLERSNIYFETMKCMYQKITIELTKPLIHKENSNNYYMLLEVIGTWTNWTRIFRP